MPIKVIQLHPVAEEKNAHPQAPSLVLEAVAAEAQVEMLDSAETISESADQVPVDNPKVKTETDQIDEGLHWVSRTLVDDKEDPPTVVLSEREIEPLNARPKRRPLRNVERLVCQSK